MRRCRAATLAGLLIALAGCGGGGTVTGERMLMAEAVLGPAGGVLAIDQGAGSGFRLDVPPGALAAPTLVRILMPSDPPAPVVSFQIAVEPESVELQAPVQVTVPYFGPEVPARRLRGVVTTLSSGTHVSPVLDVLLVPARALFDADCFGVMSVELDPPTVNLRDFLPAGVNDGQFEDGLRCLWLGSTEPDKLLVIRHVASGTDETLQLRWGVEALELRGATPAPQTFDVLEHAIPWAPLQPEQGEVSGGSPIAGFSFGSEPLYRGAVANSARLFAADPIETPAGLFTDVARLQTMTVWVRGPEVTESVRQFWLARDFGVVAVQFGDGPILRLLVARLGGGPSGR